MDFDRSEQHDQFRAEVREFFLDHCTPEVHERVSRSGTVHDWPLHRALAERRWLAPTWPDELGGLGWDPVQDAIFREEAARTGAPLDGVSTTMYVAETLRHIGTQQQRTEFLRPLLDGEEIVALGFTEPDAGSDVANARTRANPHGDRWVISGQKMFTTLAHEARWVFLLTRTDTNSKHGGLTMFLVPLDADGVEILPIHTLGGERTNVTFYKDVSVPDTCRVGEINGGWSVLNLALGIEHGISFSGECLRLLDHGVAVATLHREPGGWRLADDPLVLNELGRAAVDAEVSRLLAYRAAWMTSQGSDPAAEGPMAKLFSSEALVRHASAMVDILGPDGLVGADVPSAPVGGALEHAFRHSVVTTIYGGSSEVQRGIIAERRLGLSRRLVAR